MSELGVTHFTDDVILTAAQLNAGQRRTSRELQTMLQHWLFGDSAPSAGGGGVVGGLVVDNVAGQMQLTVSAGSAFYYDAGVSSPLSPFKLILHPNSDIVNVTAADATHPRIDVVSIKAPTGTDTEETCLVYEAASGTYATQRGAQPVITVTAGTPASSPSAPSTPAGELKLAEVLIPAAASNLNSATITDSRSFSRGPKNRGPESRPDFVFHVPAGKVYMATAHDTVDGRESTLLVDTDEGGQHWPKFNRPATGAAGESVGSLGLMLLNTDGRTWWETVPWASSDVGYAAGSATEIPARFPAEHGSGAYVLVENENTGACHVVLYLSPQVQQRGLKVVGARVRHQVVAEWDGTISALAVQLSHYAANGTLTTVGSVSLSNTADAAPVVQDLTIASPVLLAAGDQLQGRFNLWRASGGSAGAHRLYTLEIQFEEGHA